MNNKIAIVQKVGYNTDKYGTTTNFVQSVLIIDNVHTVHRFSGYSYDNNIQQYIRLLNNYDFTVIELEDIDIKIKGKQKKPYTQTSNLIRSLIYKRINPEYYTDYLN